MMKNQSKKQKELIKKTEVKQNEIQGNIKNDFRRKKQKNERIKNGTH